MECHDVDIVTRRNVTKLGYVARRPEARVALSATTSAENQLEQMKRVLRSPGLRQESS